MESVEERLEIDYQNLGFQEHKGHKKLLGVNDLSPYIDNGIDNPIFISRSSDHPISNYDSDKSWWCDLWLVCSRGVCLFDW